MGGWFDFPGRQLVGGFPLVAGETVLDIGCGEGAFAAFCAEMGARVLLADVDAGELRQARARVRATGHAPLALLTDGCPLPLPDACVDTVIAMEVLEHVPDPDLFLRELVRVARPGARFLITVPAEAAEQVQRALAPEPYFRPPNHVRVFTAAGLEELAVGAGLVVERRLAYGFYWALWWAFFWTCRQDVLDPPHPILRSWAETWRLVLASPDGPRIKAALDAQMPKSQGLIARKSPSR